MNRDQLKLYVIRPALKHIGLWTLPAENLVYGTGSHESGGWQWIDQTTPGPGPAYGPFQMEEATFEDHLRRLRRPENAAIYSRLMDLRIRLVEADVTEMHGNWFFAAAMCRIHYWFNPEPLPSNPDDIRALGEYWKKHYNTFKGKGTVDEFVRDYR